MENKEYADQFCLMRLMYMYLYQARKKGRAYAIYYHTLKLLIPVCWQNQLIVPNQCPLSPQNYSRIDDNTPKQNLFHQFSISGFYMRYLALHCFEKMH